MKNNECNIVQDLLPLYVDDVVSEDSKQLVTKHLSSCKECQKQYEQMTGKLVVAMDQDTTLFEKVERKWRWEKWRTMIVSAFTVAILCFGLFVSLFYITKPIAYSKDYFTVKEMADDLYVVYDGAAHERANFTAPIRMNVDGEMKNVAFVYYEASIANNTKRKNLKKMTSPERKDSSFIAAKEDVDVIYYGEFEINEPLNKTDSLQKQMKQMTLIWEKE